MVVSLTRRPPFTPQEGSWHSFLLEAELTPGPIVRLERLGQLKKEFTLSWFEPATFRLVAQCLNQLRHRVPPSFIVPSKIYLTTYLATTLNVRLTLLKREASCLAKQYKRTQATGVSTDINDGHTVLPFRRLFYCKEISNEERISTKSTEISATLTSNQGI
jgi:hypothetical protein